MYIKYIKSVAEGLKERYVTPKELRSKLLKESAFSHSKQEQTFFSVQNLNKLSEAKTIHDAIELLAREYASFLNYDIFQFIIKEFGLDDGQEDFHYPQYLKDFIERHKISEFFGFNPLLKKMTSETSKTELVLKLDIEATSKLAKLIDIQRVIANFLKIPPAALRLVDISEGCVQVTYEIPTHVAELVSCKDTDEKKILSDYTSRQVRWWEIPVKTTS